MRTQVTFIVDGPVPHVCDDAITNWIGSSFRIERWSVIYLDRQEMSVLPFKGDVSSTIDNSKIGESDEEE